MRIAALCLAALSPCFAGEPGQDDHDHSGTFEEALAHRSGPDLRTWRDAHPWSLGDRIAEFLGELLAARRAGERTAIERRDLDAAFLAEAIAEDPYSGWLVQVLRWDTEAAAHQESAADAARLLPELIADGEGDAAWAQIEEFRGGVVPEGGWPLLGADLARCAAAYLHAGDPARARNIATELVSSAEDRLQGVVLYACERVLGELSRIDGSLADAARRNARAFEIAASLDPGPTIEAFEACDIDTLVELAAGEKETLLVVVGGKGRAARTLPIGGDTLADRIRTFVGAPKFDAATARSLHESLLGPDAALLGSRIGIVADGVFANLPFEALVIDDGAGARPPRFLASDRIVVRLSRPPLGRPVAASTPSASKRTWLVILDEPTAIPALAYDEIRVLRGASLDVIRGAAGIRGGKLDAELAILAKYPAEGLADALHAAGVRDVLCCLRNPGAGEQRFLADVCGRVAGGKPLLEAIGEARSAAASDTWSWATWVVRRRS